MWELYRKYVTPLYLTLIVCCIFYGLWYRDILDDPVVLIYGMAMGMEERYWIYPIIAAVTGVLVYIFTGNDWIQVDLYAVYMLAGYFAVTWLGIGARRLFRKAFEEEQKNK